MSLGTTAPAPTSAPDSTTARCRTIEPVPISDDRGFALGDHGPAVAEFQGALARYGYGIAASGTFDAAMGDVVVAFQRHFRPARVDGIADHSTIATLARLLAARPII